MKGYMNCLLSIWGLWMSIIVKKGDRRMRSVIGELRHDGMT